MKFRALPLAVLSAWSTGLARAGAGAPAVSALIRHGQLLSAGEAVRKRLEANPKDTRYQALLRHIEARVRGDLDDSEFDPRKYFYAQAYLDYFERGQYRTALEDMSQVLALDMENEEVLRFMDQAEGRTKMKDSLGPETRRRAPRPPTMPQPAAESVYREALLSYVRGDMAGAALRLRELLAREPSNERWAKALQRVQRELKGPG